MLDVRGAACSGCSRLFVPGFAATGRMQLLAKCVFSCNPDPYQDFFNGQLFLRKVLARRFCSMKSSMALWFMGMSSVSKMF